MGEPVGLSAITAGITTVIKVFEVTYQLKAVGEQTADLLDTTQHVELNIREARRLRRLKDKLLNTGERTWMDKVIEDTENAVRAVAQLIEPSRVGMQTKQGIDLGHRAVWVFRDSPKVRDKFARLAVCHQTLNTVVTCLYSRDIIVVAPVAEVRGKDPPPPYDPQMDELFSWRRNNRRRRKDVDGSTGETSPTISLTMGPPTSPVAQHDALAACHSTAKTQDRAEGWQAYEDSGTSWASENLFGAPLALNADSPRLIDPRTSNTKKGRRSWLAYQATRSDLGHGST
ncbi:MAG: hypothetical protein M1830_004319 [Pleopsidium flavum]|nr:MAG: hypothetical protein M1830_004319 [Pleopsidium flavum]